MTEGTPAAFAVAKDVADRWRPLTTAQTTVADSRLEDASALLRLAFPDIDTRAAAKPPLAALAKSRVVDAVIRVLRNPDGAKQVQETIGPRSYGLTFPDGTPTGVFFTDDELDPLRPTVVASSASPGVGTAFAAIRPGWGPTTPGWGGLQL